jgi:hypothetical protein
MNETTAQTKAQARLFRSLNVMNDALYLAVRRTGDAAQHAEDVDAALASALTDIHDKLSESSRILDELLAELPQ